MFYKIANYFLEKKITKLRLTIKKLLVNDLKEQKKLILKIKAKDEATCLVYGDRTEGIEKNIQTILNRLEIEDQYVLLFGYLKDDTKRKYIINNNFYKFLEAIKFLYSTSSISTNSGYLTAPGRVYYAISAVEDCFNELMSIYKLHKNN